MATKTLTCTADVSISEKYSGNAYDAADRLAFGVGSGSTDEYYALLKFSSLGLSSSAYNISSAKLTVTKISGALGFNAAFNAIAQRITSSWSESTTWSSKPSSTSTGQSSAVSMGTGHSGSVTFDVTDIVRAWADDSSSQYGILLKQNDQNGITASRIKCIASRTASSGAAYITVTYAAKTYTVSYNANGGSGAPSSQTKTYGTNLTLSSTKPTRSNSTATGYKVTFNANGGSCSTASLTSTLTTSYTFKNWNTASGGTGTSYSAGGTYSANAAATLYAQWTSSTSKGSVTLPTAARTGYAFKGWSTSSTATSGTAAGSAYTPSAATTLYATWKANTYTVSFNANGGSGAPSNQTKTYGTNLTLSSTKPTRPGYQFLGWGTSASDTSVDYAAGATYSANAAITLYAIWQLIGIVYIDNGSGFEAYQVYIDNGSEWELYLAYIDNGSSWDECSL